MEKTLEVHYERTDHTDSLLWLTTSFFLLENVHTIVSVYSHVSAIS
jgi:hypothetical protein